MTESYLEALDQLSALHQKTTGLNPALEKRYPLAVVEGGVFLIHDIHPESGDYHFIQQALIPMPVPDGVRAAFQINELGGRIACVVTPDVFATQEGFITILHEFVHCFQYETCEQNLKMGLDIARKALEVGNTMWEIEHPFPYNAEDFIKPYTQFLQALEKQDHDMMLNTRKVLKSYLGVHDYEYMVWEEWKEGFARWVENLVKRYLGMKENKSGLQQPFSRLVFYAGGEAYIDYLAESYPPIVNDLTALFVRMQTI